MVVLAGVYLRADLGYAIVGPGGAHQALQALPDLDDLLTSCPAPDAEQVLGGGLDRAADLIDALYAGKTEQYTETEVTYEDGRKGKISATLEIRDAATVPVGAPAQVAAE